MTSVNGATQRRSPGYTLFLLEVGGAGGGRMAEGFHVFFIHNGMWLCIIDGRPLGRLSAALDPFEKELMLQRGES